MKKNYKSITLVVIIVVVAFILGLLVPDESYIFGLHHMGLISMENMDEHRVDLLAERDSMVKEMLASGNYRCCLMKPCSYCIEKTPGHGEGATCDCLKDIVEGRHPCGECIGEILEGHGNKYLAEYFAKAIAEEVGMDHLDTLKKIISEKYNVPIEKLK